MTDVRYTPLYTAAEVAFYTGLSTRTVRRWAFGERNREPVLKRRATDGLRLTFLDFVELELVGTLRRQGVPLKEIEALYRSFIGSGQESNPLSVEQEIHRFGNRLVAVDRSQKQAREMVSGQYNFLAIVLQFGKKLEYDRDRRALRLFPDDKKDIVIDPAVRFGAPTVADTRVDTASLFELFEAEKDAKVVAEWYDIPVERVKAAIAWETQLRSPAA